MKLINLKFFTGLFSILFITMVSTNLYAANTSSWNEKPASVAAGKTYTVKVNYTLDEPGLLHVQMFNKDWKRIGEVYSSSAIPAGSGTANLQLPINTGTPSATGNILQAMLLKSNWDDLKVPKLEADNINKAADSNANTISWNQKPESVAAGKTYEVKVNYTLNEPGLVFVQISNKDWKKLGQVYSTTAIPAGSGTATLQLPIDLGTPSATGNILQAELRKSNWDDLKVTKLEVDNITKATDPNPDSNTISWNQKPSSVTAGETYTVKVNYTLKEPGLVFVQIFNNGWSKLGQAYSTNAIPAGTGTATLQLPINTGTPSATGNILQAELRKSNWDDLQVTKLEVDNITSGGGSSCSLGKWCASDPSGTQYVDNSYVPGSNQLGNGYKTGWWLAADEVEPGNYLPNKWEGPIKAHFGESGNNGGTNFWMEWNNNNSDDSSWKPEYGHHAEFDVFVSKSGWSYQNETYGYSKKIKEINGDITCSMNGQWAPGSKGRVNINMTAWITVDPVRDSKQDSRCDIIIHAWDNSGDVSLNQGWTQIGPNLQNRNDTYKVFQRGGDVQELASFNIIPISNTNTNPYEDEYFPTSVVDKKIDVKVFINHIINHAIGDATAINDNWYIHDLEWTITGQSAMKIGGKHIPDSEGRWTFNNYYIPNLNASNTTLKVSNLNTKEEITVYPNPFTNSFNIEYNLTKEEPVSVKLFSHDGKLIQFIKNKENEAIGSYTETVNTSNLPSGIYHIQVISSTNRSIKKLVKF